MKTKSYLLLAGCCAVLTGFPHSAQAAVTEAWVRRYSNIVSNTTDRAVKAVRDATGNIIVTGTSYDGITPGALLTIKYSGADGALLWEKRHNSSVDYYRAYHPVAVAVDDSGNVIVTGSSNDGAPHTDYYTAKYAAADGALLWEQHYDGPANGYDSAGAVAVDGSGNVVVTGFSVGSVKSFGDHNQDYYTAKYAAADGALLWEQRYNGPANSQDYGAAVAVDSSGNVVVTGYSYKTNYTNPDYYTAKYAAADGALLWEQRYTNGIAGAVAVDGSGNVVVTGSSATVKYAAADGALLWEQRYNGPGNGFHSTSAVAVDGSGNVAVTGYSYNGGGYWDYDYYTAKYAATDGVLLWEKRYNGPANDFDNAGSVAVDGSGNVVVTGSSYKGINSGGFRYGADYYTAKYAAADGALLWEQRYNGPGDGNDYAYAVVVDGGGNVVVTGDSIGTGSSEDYYTAKYAAANGALLWEQRHDGSANDGSGSAAAVALDGSGNVVVTGYSVGSGGNNDYYTAKYAARDGALLWENRYNGPANGEDYAIVMTMDGSGNVVVTGPSSYDYYTAKYATADGALLWENRYDGPANGVDFPLGVAVDGSGNVVVTGYSGFYPYYDYYTAKYAAADGALLWENRSDDPANDIDAATAVAVDGSGNVVVTGYSGFYPYYDYYTAKYASANGALLWEQRYNGPANYLDAAWAVAVDARGSVLVTGNSGTIKYLANGTAVWTNNAGATAIAVDGSGNVVVTGTFGYDYYTAKYASADGALLWEKHYNGPANGDDEVAFHGLALGPNGMVAVTGTSSGDYATVVYRENLSPVSIALVPAGVRLRFTGIPGRTYAIERAPAITGPWSTLATPVAPASGLIEHTDVAPPAGSAFYRTVAVSE
jgi:outer membrane protein assembly factor BamB